VAAGVSNAAKAKMITQGKAVAALVDAVADSAESRIAADKVDLAAAVDSAVAAVPIRWVDPAREVSAALIEEWAVQMVAAAPAAADLAGVAAGLAEDREAWVAVPAAWEVPILFAGSTPTATAL
jgi:hypothetical protein